MSDTDLKQRLAAILAADAAGYSRLMSLDERGTVATLDAARAVFRSYIESHQGRVIDMAGDSVLAVFETATGAVSAALTIQAQINPAAQAQPESQRMQFRIGVHMGDIIEKADGTVYGDGVNIAARLQVLAEPGGVTVSESIHTAVRGKVSATFVDQGEQTVKNIAHPVRAWQVQVGDSPESATASTAKSVAGEIDLSLPDKPSIAVLAFANMSGDPEQEYFTDGITEDIITELSRFHSLFVIARNSSFTYKGKSVDVRTVSKELGVRYVLEGSIRRAGNRIRVTAQLIDALTGNHIWAEKYDRVLEDIFEVQAEIAQSIALAVSPVVSAAEEVKVRRRQKDLTAYELAIRARTYFVDGNVRTERALIEKSLETARAALAIDQDLAPALVVLAYGSAVSIQNSFASDPEVALKQGLEAADRLIRLDATDSQGYVAKSFLLYWKIDEDHIEDARALSRRAIELNSNDQHGWWTLAAHESGAGNHQIAIEMLQKVLRLSPRDPAAFLHRMLLAVCFFGARDYAFALVEIKRAMVDAPQMGYLQIFAAYINAALGDMVSARAAFGEAKRLAPELVQRRLNGVSPIRNAELRNRATLFLRIAAGLEDPSAADAYR